MQVDEDHKYLKALQNGNLQAIEILVEKYYPVLFNFLRRLGCPSSDAEDIIQETLIKVARGIGRYQHKERFRAWLFKVCHNSYRDYYKKAARRLELAIDPGTMEISATLNPEIQALEREQARRVQEILDRLPPPQRLVLVLRYYHEFSLKEIARIVCCPVGTVKSRLNNAMRSLKKYLEEDLG